MNSIINFAKQCLLLLINVLAIIGIVILMIVVYNNRNDAGLANDVHQNFRVIVGLPIVAAVAFMVVTVFRQPQQPMTVKILGLDFSGHSGEVFMWTIIVAVLGLLIDKMWVPVAALPHT